MDVDSASDISESVKQNNFKIINPMDFVRDRVQQISELIEAVDNKALISGEVTKGPRTAMQRLPRHIRRRAMSYNIKRFPRSARRFALSSVAISKHRKKPPSRFYRRRPPNLLSNYIRRQKKQIWLETHIWHAKRFKMIEKWGYKLPLHSYQRSFRATFRDCKRHCVARDISYLRCFQIFCMGKSKLISALQVLFAPDTRATFANDVVFSGKFEIPVLLYEPGRYPQGLIGPVRISWNSMSSEEISLILWTHPSVSNYILSLLIRLLKLSLEEASRDDIQVDNAPKSLNEWRVNNSIRFDSYISPDGFKLYDLRDQLVRIRLQGPESLVILGSIFQTVSLSDLTEDWMKHFSEWNNYWNTNVRYRSPEELLDCSVLQILIEDPRLSRPTKKTLPNKKSSTKVHDFKPVAFQITDHLWNVQTRNEICKNKLNNMDIQLKRSENLFSPSTSPAKIPVNLVIQNGNSSSDHFVSVDIVAPPSFGMELWVALQFGTVRAAGLRDQLHSNLEAEKLNFPADIPCCSSAIDEASNESKELMERYEARPHNRRIKYWDDLSILFPFSFEWAHLTREWLESISQKFEEPYVLQDLQILSLIDDWLQGRRAKLDDDRLFKKFSSALIPVRLTSVGTGCPQRFSIICIPKEEDISNIEFFKEKEILVEPVRESSSIRILDERPEEEPKRPKDLEEYVDLNEIIGETTVSLNALFPDKETLRNDARIMKKKAKRKKEKSDRIEKKENELHSNQYRESCSRAIIGRVVRGDYSFTRGKGLGLGYICLAAIEKFPKSIVVYRNPTSRYYHYARISVLLTRIDL